MADEQTDFELLVAARSGDSTSFAELVERHAPRLLGLARHVVGPDSAEDVVQEAMIDAYRGLSGFRGDAAVSTWLYRITLNRCLAELRRRKADISQAEPIDLLRRWEDPDYSVDPALVAARRQTGRVAFNRCRRGVDLWLEGHTASKGGEMRYGVAWALVWSVAAACVVILAPWQLPLLVRDRITTRVLNRDGNRLSARRRRIEGDEPPGFGRGSSH